ncbi:hypothetical protein BH23PLA1_BH23PLA1_20490 [soil metagenome]
MRPVRASAILLGVLILLVQAINAASGRGLHTFLLADLVVGPWLIFAGLLRDERTSAVGMLAAFSATAGVLFAATTGRLLMGGFDSRTVLAALGMIHCGICSAWLARGISGNRLDPEPEPSNDQ